MNVLLRVGLLGALLVVVTACAPAQRLQEVQLPPQRIFQKGYSLTPLDEQGWFVSQRNAHQLVIGKHNEGSDETNTIQATLIQLAPFTTTQEFLRMVKDGQDQDSRGFKIVTHDVIAYPDKGSNCAKSYLVAEDHVAVKGKSGYMTLQLLILTCAHPGDKSIGVNVAYSRRSYPEQQSTGFSEKALIIFNSVALEDF